MYIVHGRLNQNYFEVAVNTQHAQISKTFVLYAFTFSFILYENSRMIFKWPLTYFSTSIIFDTQNVKICRRFRLLKSLQEVYSGKKPGWSKLAEEI